MTIFATNLQARAHVYILSVFIGPFYSCSVQCQKNVFVEGVYRVSFFFFCLCFVCFISFEFFQQQKKTIQLKSSLYINIKFCSTR